MVSDMPGTKTTGHSCLRVLEAETGVSAGWFPSGDGDPLSRPSLWLLVVCWKSGIFWRADAALSYLPSSPCGPGPVRMSVSRLPLYEGPSPIGSGACPTSV